MEVTLKTISYGAWESYLQKMSIDGVWGDWITLWGLINMLNIDVALVSSLGVNGLRNISPADASNKDGTGLREWCFLGTKQRPIITAYTMWIIHRSIRKRVLSST